MTTKTYAQLTAQTTVLDTDLLARPDMFMAAYSLAGLAFIATGPARRRSARPARA